MTKTAAPKFEKVGFDSVYRISEDGKELGTVERISSRAFGVAWKVRGERGVRFETRTQAAEYLAGRWCATHGTNCADGSHSCGYFAR